MKVTGAVQDADCAGDRGGGDAALRGARLEAVERSHVPQRASFSFCFSFDEPPGARALTGSAKARCSLSVPSPKPLHGHFNAC